MQSYKSSSVASSFTLSIQNQGGENPKILLVLVTGVSLVQQKKNYYVFLTTHDS